MTAGDPSRRPDPDDLFSVVDHLDVPGGGRLTVEPGGQVELSSRPHAGAGPAIEATAAGVEGLRSALDAAGVHTSALGLDPARPNRRIVSSPRYDAMEAYFEGDGGAGLSMMCATASVQVNLDLGDPADLVRRWRVAHTLGPVLVAAFANSPLAVGRPHRRQVVPPAGVGGARPAPGRRRRCPCSRRPTPGPATRWPPGSCSSGPAPPSTGRSART